MKSLHTPVLLIVVVISGCSDLAALKKEQNLIKEYPECYHQYRSVFEKCIELSKNGTKINALRVEEMMKSGELQ